MIIIAILSLIALQAITYKILMKILKKRLMTLVKNGNMPASLAEATYDMHITNWIALSLSFMMIFEIATIFETLSSLKRKQIKTNNPFLLAEQHFLEERKLQKRIEEILQKELP